MDHFERYAALCHHVGRDGRVDATGEERHGAAAHADGQSARTHLGLSLIHILKYRLTPEEVLTAVTLNGAAAIDMADKVGTVEAGKLGDLVIWDAPDLDYICYRFGSNLAKKVIKRGRVM